MVSFLLKIITPARVLFQKEVVSATLPVLGGQVTILPHHMPIIGALSEGGEIIVRDAEERTHFLLSIGGCMEFHGETLTLLVNDGERAEDIDIEAAEKAKARAEELRKNAENLEGEEHATILLAIEREASRIRIAKKHHHHHHGHHHAS
ncbi:MAG: ATP synthase F1 subunit epsilon [Candidatus Peregrinibacteria bacterium]